MLVEVTRGELVECVHRGSVVAVRPDGSVALSLGTTGPVLPRSSNKPLQAVGLLELGWAPARSEHLALSAASHSGEEQHTQVVREMLTLLPGSPDPENVLGCPSDLPLSRDAARGVDGPRRLTMNCSGKHAAMLLTCATRGWALEGYLDPAHPLQVALTETVGRLAGEPVVHVVTDGCGAPQHALTLRGLAGAFGALARSGVAGSINAGSAGGPVATAMAAHPELVGGSGRDVTTLMQRLPGAVAKDGADGAYAVGLPDGSAVALKIEDGAERARTPVLVAALAALGVDVAGLADLAVLPVLGGGVPVGQVHVPPGTAARLAQAAGRAPRALPRRGAGDRR